LKLLFSLFDTDHDGRITQDEIKLLVETVSGHPWGEEQLSAFMQIVDTDSNHYFFLFN
jgi:Ca2+-binding EF-hand superfamily protein